MQSTSRRLTFNEYSVEEKRIAYIKYLYGIEEETENPVSTVGRYSFSNIIQAFESEEDLEETKRKEKEEKRKKKKEQSCRCSVM